MSFHPYDEKMTLLTQNGSCQHKGSQLAAKYQLSPQMESSRSIALRHAILSGYLHGVTIIIIDIRFLIYR